MSEIKELADLLKSNKYKNVIVMTGAGVSVAAGIPDFRSPSIGIYATVREAVRFNFRSPYFVFDIDFFIEDPRYFWWIFFTLWPKDEWPVPTDMHYFISLLKEKGLLLRNYTQNVDGLEFSTGLNEEDVVEAHGVLTKCHCCDCNKEVKWDVIYKCLEKNRDKNLTPENVTIPICPHCNKNHVKPDVTFFGEDLPSKFYKSVRKDCSECDMLIVVGTSLSVYPFAGLPRFIKKDVPMILINNKKVNHKTFFGALRDLFTSNNYVFDFSKDNNIFIGGDCQESARQLIEELGWQAEFDALKEKHKDEENYIKTVTSEVNND